MPAYLTPAETFALLENHSGHVLLDVRHPERHAMARPAPAVGNCVFEVAFLSRMPAVAAPDTPVILCGEDGDSREAEVAAGKLERAGYLDIAILQGGHAAWKDLGLPIVGHGEPSPSAGFTGRLAIDTAESSVEWTGRNLINKHHGTVAIAGGELAFENGRLAGGKIILDMTSIACADLAGTPLHDVLIAHLADDDFFDTANFPTACLELDATPVALEGAPGGPNLKVSARLELRGVTRPIGFDAAAGWTNDRRAAAQAAFAIDRTRWNVLYGSGKFFRHLAGHLVNDLVEFQVRLLTEPVT